MLLLLAKGQFCSQKPRGKVEVLGWSHTLQCGMYINVPSISNSTMGILIIELSEFGWVRNKKKWKKILAPPLVSPSIKLYFFS
jgi:hypothetical protein